MLMGRIPIEAKLGTLLDPATEKTMGVEQLSSSKPILCFKVMGMLTRSEVDWLQSKAVAGIANWGKVRALVILENFEGWKKGPGWDDMSFSSEHDRNIERMAIVGPEHWRDWACAFAGKGFRSVAVEYFEPSQLEQANAWLSSEAADAESGDGGTARRNS
jgi:hypothetical protein